MLIHGQIGPSLRKRVIRNSQIYCSFPSNVGTRGLQTFGQPKNVLLKSKWPRGSVVFLIVIVFGSDSQNDSAVFGNYDTLRVNLLAYF